MPLHFFNRSLCSLLLVGISCSAKAKVVTITGGEVHLTGALAENGCVVSTKSRDMHVDMGKYTDTRFHGVGSEATLHIPFYVRLTGCNPDVAKRMRISFYGMTDPKEPDVFLVTSGEGGAVGISGDKGFSGLGLVISDAQGNPVAPYSAHNLTYRVERDGVVMPFTAHYRATSRTVYPGPLRSDVWFRIVYP